MRHYRVIFILQACQREIAALPEEIREDLADALARLQEDEMLSMPLSRPMPAIGKGVHELRLRDRSGIYRIIYWIRKRNEIHLIHAFAKKSQQTPPRAIEIAKKRIREAGA